MDHELEIKILDINKDRIRELLTQAGASMLRPEVLMTRSIFWLPESGSVQPPIAIDKDNHTIAFGEQLLVVSDVSAVESILGNIFAEDIPGKNWLRVRNEGDKVTMSLKRQTGAGVEDAFEIEVTVSDYETATELMGYLGCGFKSYQETKREIWMLDHTTICIDEWPHLKPFLEIEAGSIPEIEAAVSQIGLETNERFVGTAGDLYAYKLGISAELVNDRTPELRFGQPYPFIP